MTPGFLIHGERDHVGVAVRDLKAGETVTGVYLHSRQTVQLMAVEDIPLGHKMALIGLRAGDQVLKYNEVIGTATRSIETGQHVHIHNLQSVRWAHP